MFKLFSASPSKNDPNSPSGKEVRSAGDEQAKPAVWPTFDRLWAATLTIDEVEEAQIRQIEQQDPLYQQPFSETFKPLKSSADSPSRGSLQSSSSSVGRPESAGAKRATLLLSAKKPPPSPQATRVEFVNPPPPHLICSVCRQVFSTPLRTNCGHSYCKKCVATLAEESDKHCRVCRQPYLTSNLIISELPADNELQKEIDGLAVYCRRRAEGCSDTFPFAERASHERTCRCAPVRCGFKLVHPTMRGTNRTAHRGISTLELVSTGPPIGRRTHARSRSAVPAVDDLTGDQLTEPSSDLISDSEISASFEEEGTLGRVPSDDSIASLDQPPMPEVVNNVHRRRASMSSSSSQPAAAAASMPATPQRSAADVYTSATASSAPSTPAGVSPPAPFGLAASLPEEPASESREPSHADPGRGRTSEPRTPPRSPSFARDRTALRSKTKSLDMLPFNSPGRPPPARAEEPVEAATLTVGDPTNECSHTCMRWQLQEHQDACPFRLVFCRNEGCSYGMSQSLLAAHDGECQYAVMPCPNNCGATMIRKNQGNHLQKECPVSSDVSAFEQFLRQNALGAQEIQKMALQKLRYQENQIKQLQADMANAKAFVESVEEYTSRFNGIYFTPHVHAGDPLIVEADVAALQAFLDTKDKARCYRHVESMFKNKEHRFGKMFAHAVESVRKQCEDVKREGDTYSVATNFRRRLEILYRSIVATFAYYQAVPGLLAMIANEMLQRLSDNILEVYTTRYREEDRLVQEKYDSLKEATPELFGVASELCVTDGMDDFTEEPSYIFASGAISLLSQLSEHRLAPDKQNCVFAAFQMVENSLANHFNSLQPADSTSSTPSLRKRRELGGDEVIPMCFYVVLKARVQAPWAQLRYMQELSFEPVDPNSPMPYIMAHFESALMYVGGATMETLLEDSHKARRDTVGVGAERRLSVSDVRIGARSRGSSVSSELSLASSAPTPSTPTSPSSPAENAVSDIDVELRKAFPEAAQDGGLVVAKFACKWSFLLRNGFLYVTESHLYFVGGSDKDRLPVAWRDVCMLRKAKQLVFDNSIEVVVVNSADKKAQKEELVTHRFTMANSETRNKIFWQLYTLHVRAQATMETPLALITVDEPLEATADAAAFDLEFSKYQKVVCEGNCGIKSLDDVTYLVALLMQINHENIPAKAKPGYMRGGGHITRYVPRDWHEKFDEQQLFAVWRTLANKSDFNLKMKFIQIVRDLLRQKFQDAQGLTLFFVKDKTPQQKWLHAIVGVSPDAIVRMDLETLKSNGTYTRHQLVRQTFSNGVVTLELVVDKQLYHYNFVALSSDVVTMFHMFDEHTVNAARPHLEELAK